MTDNHDYKRFVALNLDRDALGLKLDNENAAYFCTPVGAQIIGWLGVDGIHFCFIPSISDNMVFAVSPMPCGTHYVEPVAGSFLDFLSLILFCKDAGFLEGISYTDENHFYQLVQAEEDAGYLAREDALDTLRLEFGMDAHINAYQYVKRLQADFDYTTIPFSDAYYEAV